MSLLLERGHGMSRVYMGKDLFITYCKHQSDQEECDEDGIWVTKRFIPSCNNFKSVLGLDV